MNPLWNFVDWILPAVRITDDLDDPYALSDDGLSLRLHSVSPASSPPKQRYSPDARRDSYRDREKDREREKERERERRVVEEERERDRQRILGLERENAALQARLQAYEGELQSARHSLATATLLAGPASPVSPGAAQTASSLPHASFSYTPASGDLRSSYDSLRSAYAATHQTLQERTEEVASLKSFLSKTDEWSGAQLIQALRDMNAEIVQLAASVAEEFSPSLDRRADLARPSDRDLVMDAIGPVMMALLTTREHEGDPTLVQFAIQAWEVCCVGRVLDAFCYGLPPDVDQVLTGIFDCMHRTEPQPVTSRWRALTYKHARTLLAPQPTPFQTLNETNLRGLLAILALAGCTDSRGLHRDPLRARFGSAVARISALAERITTVVKEGVMSGAFDVVWLGARKWEKDAADREQIWFDWATMENVYAGHGEERCRVLCTVEFGLECTRRDGEASSGCLVNGTKATNGHVNGLANGHALADGPMTRTLLLKPKVLLESVTEIL